MRRATLDFVGVSPTESALRPPRGMFRIGPPNAHVDVTTKIDGIADFERVWEQRSSGEFFGVPVDFLSIDDMLRTKRAARRSHLSLGPHSLAPALSEALDARARRWRDRGPAPLTCGNGKA